MVVPGEFSGTGAKSRTCGAFLGNHRSMVSTTDRVREADRDSAKWNHYTHRRAAPRRALELELAVQLRSAFPHRDQSETAWRREPVCLKTHAPTPRAKRYSRPSLSARSFGRRVDRLLRRKASLPMKVDLDIAERMADSRPPSLREGEAAQFGQDVDASRCGVEI
jgi:hypothetical protein